MIVVSEEFVGLFWSSAIGLHNPHKSTAFRIIMTKLPFDLRLRRSPSPIPHIPKNNMVALPPTGEGQSPGKVDASLGIASQQTPSSKATTMNGPDSQESQISEANNNNNTTTSTKRRQRAPRTPQPSKSGHFFASPAGQAFDGGKNGVHFSFPVPASLPSDVQKRMLELEKQRDLTKPPIVYGSSMKNKLTQAEYDSLPNAQKGHYDMCISLDHPRPRAVVSIYRKEMEDAVAQQWGGTLNLFSHSSLNGYPPFDKSKLLYTCQTLMADKYGWLPDLTRAQLEKAINSRHRAEVRKQGTLATNARLQASADTNPAPTSDAAHATSEATDAMDEEVDVGEVTPKAIKPDPDGPLISDMLVSSTKSTPILVEEGTPSKKPRLSASVARSESAPKVSLQSSCVSCGFI